MASRLKLFLPLILFVVLALFLYRGLSMDPRELPSALIDKPFPVFALSSLADGNILRRDTLTGEVSLVNVWATWCVSCRVEHPYLEKLAAEGGVRIVGINYKDDENLARRWLQQLGNPYALILSDTEGKLGLDLGVYGAPETYLVDAQGVIRYRHVGVIDEKIWTTVLAPLYREVGGRAPAGQWGSTGGEG
ncbi:MAG: DsbE family thiol:disulfide interchange protein [Parahaliea sp.]